MKQPSESLGRETDSLFSRFDMVSSDHCKPLVSVVIPTKNSERTLSNCLASIKKQTYKCIEIVVVDNASTDRTVEIASDFCKVLFHGPERSAQRNFGAKRSNGEYLLFVDSDMELTPEVIEECVRRVQLKRDNVQVIPEISTGEGFWAKCRSLEKSCYVGDEKIEAARFFDRRVFMECGGYDEKMTGPEDWDLSLRIRRGGHTVSRINAPIIHREGKISMTSLVKKKYYYGKTMNEYVKKHPEAAHEQLTIFRSAFLRNWRILLRDPLHAVGMFVLKTCEFAAGALGFICQERSLIKASSPAD